MPPALPPQDVLERGWSAADVDPSEYVSDSWIATNTAAGRRPSKVRHLGQRTLLAVKTIGVDPYEDADRLTRAIAGTRTAKLPRPIRRALIQRGGLTREQMRQVAAMTGYPVVEAWSGHNAGAMKGVWGALLHHTGTPLTAAGDYPTLRVVRDGRPGLENSLCAFGLGRSGTVYLVSEKLSWHAGVGAWNGLTDGNGFMAGIEAESPGTPGSWTAEQVDAYPRLVAAILVVIGQDDKWTTRHASFALPKGRKPDFSGWPVPLDQFWAQVYAYLANPAAIHRGQPAPAPAPAPAPVPAPAPPPPPKPVVPAVPGAPAWPTGRDRLGRLLMPAGHYFGDINGPARSHGGWAAWEKPYVQWIQRKLIALGFVPGVKDWRSGWADGVWGPQTTTAMAAYQRRWLPRTTIFGVCYSDDYRFLAAARP